MIFVQRTKKPDVIKNNESKWLETYLIALNKYRLSPTKANKKNLHLTEEKYKHNQIKEALRVMFNNKCAYCESYIGHISFGHIEHFMPKAKYPKQCFNWNNLLLGCEICNGTQFKATNFPTKKENGPIINPTKENPTSYFTFEYDPNTGTANVLGINERGKTTETLLGLNRASLVIHRSKIVRRMAFLAIKASEGDLEALNEMKLHIKSVDEYSAFAVSLFKKFKLA